MTAKTLEDLFLLFVSKHNHLYSFIHHSRIYWWHKLCCFFCRGVGMSFEKIMKLNKTLGFTLEFLFFSEVNDECRMSVLIFWVKGIHKLDFNIKQNPTHKCVGFLSVLNYFTSLSSREISSTTSSETITPPASISTIQKTTPSRWSCFLNLRKRRDFRSLQLQCC